MGTISDDIRVLIADDSRVMRRLLADILDNEPGISVVGTAKNGAEAVTMTAELAPSVVTMDIEMPVMDGLCALQHIMNETPVPVVMVSAIAKSQADIVVKALEMGAVDFIPKTSGTLSLDIEKAKGDLVAKVRAASEIEVERILVDGAKRIIVSEFKTPPKRDLVVAVGASTGGPRALLKVLSALPRDIPACLIIVQHMPNGFTRSFAERLNWQSSMDIQEAGDGDRVVKGRAYIAPGNKHLRVVDRRLRLSDGAPVNFSKPSVDLMMESVARNFKRGAIGVLLTGMGSDGARGLKTIKEVGGRTMVQNEQTCAVFGMPKAAMALNVADRVLPLDDIAGEIISVLKEM